MERVKLKDCRWVVLIFKLNSDLYFWSIGTNCNTELNDESSKTNFKTPKEARKDFREFAKLNGWKNYVIKQGIV